MKTHPRYPGYRFYENGTVERWFEKDCTTGRGANSTKFYRGWNVVGVSKQSSGYLRLKMYDANGKCKDVLLHRLICEVFHGPCPDGMECMHFPDSDKTNCRSDNLKWGTKSENFYDMYNRMTREQKSHYHTVRSRA